MDFKFIYEGLSKKLSFTLLTIIQFTIVFLCIYVAIDTFVKVNSTTKELIEVFDDGYFYELDESMCITDLASTDNRFLLEDFRELLKIKDFFDKNPKIEFLTMSYSELLIDKNASIPNSSRVNMIENLNEKEYLRVEAYCINKAYVENMNYNYIQGSHNDFKEVEKNGTLSVIVGYNYKNKYKVSDFIEVYNPIKGETEKLNIVGILNSDSYIFEESASMNKISLNNAIIFPINEEIFSCDVNNENEILRAKTSLQNYLQSGFIKLSDKELESVVNDFLIKNKFKFQLKDINQSIREFKDEIYFLTKPIIYTVTIVIIFTIISVIVVMTNSINKSKQEFGINIMLGATLKDIRNRVLGEVIMLVILSSIISIFIISFVDFVNLRGINIVITMIIIGIIVLFISIILINKLNKYSINQLVRRRE